MLPTSAENYKNMLDEDLIIESDDDAAALETMMINARLDNLRARTKEIEEKLDKHKKEVWMEWNEQVFIAFEEAFAKFKNDLISLHLNEEQLNALKDRLTESLKMLKTKLDFMYAHYKEQIEEEQNEASKDVQPS